MSSPGGLSTSRGLIVAVVASRIVTFGSAVVATVLRPDLPSWTPPPGDSAPILSGLTAWDGWWYLRIAQDGYHLAPGFSNYHDYVFFPLYPLLVRAISFAVPGWAALVAILLSNLLFILALVLLVRLGEAVVGAERARRGAALLAISPFAGVFSMAYPEALYLVLTVGALLAMERDRRMLAGVLGFAAGLARIQGAFLVIPLAILAIGRDHGVRRSSAWTLLPLLGSLLFLGFVALFTGDPLGYLHAQAAWGRGAIIGGGIDAGAAGSPGTGAAPVGPIAIFDAIALGTLFLAIFLVVYFRVDRLPWAYRASAVVHLVLPFLSGSIQSVGRYLLPAFPFDWILAGPRARWLRLAWPPVSLALLGLLSYGIFTRQFVP